MLGSAHCTDEPHQPNGKSAQQRMAQEEFPPAANLPGTLADQRLLQSSGLLLRHLLELYLELFPGRLGCNCPIQVIVRTRFRQRCDPLLEVIVELQGQIRAEANGELAWSIVEYTRPVRAEAQLRCTSIGEFLLGDAKRGANLPKHLLCRMLDLPVLDLL